MTRELPNQLPGKGTTHGSSFIKEFSYDAMYVCIYGMYIWYVYMYVYMVHTYGMYVWYVYMCVCIHICMYIWYVPLSCLELE